ncbi:glycosyltransferase family 4 protein [Candidatus Parcubacteria bacterium]|nr:glycosyltransferase family 4 protein [Candidatus Parcubacteria bacterium]
MRILIAAEIFPPDIGGPASYSEALAEALQARGFEVAVVCYSDRPDGPAQPFPVHRIVRGGKFRHYRAYAKALGRAAAGAQVIYAQGPIGSGLPAWWVSRKTGVPYVVKVVGDYAWEAYQNTGETAQRGGLHGIDEFQRRSVGGLRVRLLRFFERLVARSASRVIVPSHYLARIVAGWGVEPERISLVYNGFEAPAVPERGVARRELGVSGQMVISVGRLVPWKGFDVLLTALAQLAGVQLIIIGDGSDRTRLERIADERGVAERVRFVGRLPRERVLARLAAADVFALLSAYEGLPHTVLEAMSARTPVIVSAAGGNREVVEDGVNGLVVEPTPAAAAEAISRLLADPALRERLAANAFAGLERFSFERMIEETVGVLEKVQMSKPK